MSIDLLKGERPIKQHPSLTIPRVLYMAVVLPIAVTFLICATIFRFLFIGGDSVINVFGTARTWITGAKHGLVQRSASRTAVMVAIVRYMGSFEGWSNDVLARHFIPVELAKVIEFTKMFQPSYPLTLKRAGLLMTRTVAGDRMVINSQAQQVVLLGAGLDTRAHRLMKDCAPDCRFYEIDIATTQAMKRKVATEHATEFANKNVRYIAVDFSCESFFDKLCSESDFDPTNPQTVILFEGVSMYLPWAALEHTLRLVSSKFAPGTVLGMDCIEDFFSSPEAKKRQRRSIILPLLLRLVNAVGEPFQWGIPVKTTVQELFPPLGFELLHDVTREEVENDFLSVKPGAKPFARVPKFWHYVILKVKGEAGTVASET